MDEIREFLAKQRTSLTVLFNETKRQILTEFPNCKLRFELDHDTIYIVIQTKVGWSIAVEQLSKFDKRWWLYHMPDDGSISVVLEHV